MAAGDILHDLDFEVRAGELLVVIGPNGAGKSTLLRVLAGTLPVRSGEVRIAGHPIDELSRMDVARRVAVVSQGSDVAFGFRVEQVVMMGRSPHQGGWQVATSDDMAAVTVAMTKGGVLEHRDRLVSELSGGEQKMVALARAFAQKPDILLLDEPSAHLDPRHALALFEVVLGEVRERGLACVAIAHDLNLAAAFADRVMLLDRGIIRALGTVDEVMTAAHLERAFGVELAAHEVSGDRFFVPRRRRIPPPTPWGVAPLPKPDAD
ncbi:MAG TPA: ABC transporter ATP-binding protein [Polyangiaceae bacterium]|nr:ABC transporter ATP-binding protein [Polyangiaceae bacterium]